MRSLETRQTVLTVRELIDSMRFCHMRSRVRQRRRTTYAAHTCFVSLSSVCCCSDVTDMRPMVADHVSKPCMGRSQRGQQLRRDVGVVYSLYGYYIIAKTRRDDAIGVIIWCGYHLTSRCHFVISSAAPRCAATGHKRSPTIGPCNTTRSVYAVHHWMRSM